MTEFPPEGELFGIYFRHSFKSSYTEFSFVFYKCHGKGSGSSKAVIWSH